MLGSDGRCGQVLGIKRRLDTVINAAKSLFNLKGFVSGDDSRDDIQDAVASIERYREEAEALRNLLTDRSQSQPL